MQRLWQTRHAAQYACVGYHRGAGAPAPGCYGTAITAEVDNAVLAAVEALLLPLTRQTPEQDDRLAQWWEQLRGARDQGARDPLMEAQAARARWADAALRLVDGKIGRARYMRMRDTALEQLETTANAPTGTETREPPADPLGSWINVTSLAECYQRAVTTEDVDGKRAVLVLLIEEVVPVRTGWGKYQAAIRWRPVAEALRNWPGGSSA